MNFTYRNATEADRAAYLDFANYHASAGLDGLENRYRIQAREERGHAMLFYRYFRNNCQTVTLESIGRHVWVRGDNMTA